MELYKKKHQPYSEADFKNPPAEYRSAPFWAWNCAMMDEDIDFMTDMFKEMGMDGAQLHSRTGMALPYLQEEFMARIRHAVERAKQDGMHAWLYDEDRWPSGYGGGYITKDEYENLHDYLDEPYLAEGGNGTAKKVMSEVERLPLHE